MPGPGGNEGAQRQKAQRQNAAGQRGADQQGGNRGQRHGERGRTQQLHIPAAERSGPPGQQGQDEDRASRRAGEAEIAGAEVTDDAAAQQGHGHRVRQRAETDIVQRGEGEQAEGCEGQRAVRKIAN